MQVNFNYENYIYIQHMYYKNEKNKEKRNTFDLSERKQIQI
jgi:hypothetical protein